MALLRAGFSQCSGDLSCAWLNDAMEIVLLQHSAQHVICEGSSALLIVNAIGLCAMTLVTVALRLCV